MRMLVGLVPNTTNWTTLILLKAGMLPWHLYIPGSWASDVDTPADDDTRHSLCQARHTLVRPIKAVSVHNSIARGWNSGLLSMLCAKFGEG